MVRVSVWPFGSVDRDVQVIELRSIEIPRASAQYGLIGAFQLKSKSRCLMNLAGDSVLHASIDLVVSSSFRSFDPG